MRGCWPAPEKELQPSFTCRNVDADLRDGSTSLNELGTLVKKPSDYRCMGLVWGF